MSWDNNNVAHINLWSFERLNLVDESITFPEAGDLSVGYLIGVAAGESDDVRDVKARAHATALHKFFTGDLHADYEAGITQASAIAAMAAILRDSTKLMKDLGDTVSDAFRFQGEV